MSTLSAIAELQRPPVVTPHGLIRTALGIVLLIASAAKGYEVATEPVIQSSIFSSQWFLVGLIEFEFAFGLWLLSGLSPRESRFVAIMFWFALLLGALYEGLSGERACSCFGKLSVSPWLTFAFDLAALAALVCWQPHATRLGPRSLALRVFALLAFLLLIGVPAGGMMLADKLGTMLVPDADKIEFGDVPQGGMRRAKIWFTNSGQQSVEVTRIESSCHCLRLELQDSVVAPAEKVAAHLVLDLGTEPGFRGGLGMNVKGYSGTGKLSFTLVVKATVIPKG